VFGAGGDRDPSKRAAMGEAASRRADRVVLTSDNPRGEDPDAILAAIASGVAGERCVVRDRAEAISRAVADAAPQDVILVAGKGHESYQEIAGRRLPFSDAAVAQAALDQRGGA
jgi:UDP-N-acetylmuramoyl-L-alanyl-D-glutamate--2,6-diaminopimelate ligase